MKKNKVTVIQGWGKLTGPAKDGILTVEVEGKGGKSTDQRQERNSLDRLGRARSARPHAGRPHPDQHRSPQPQRHSEVADRDRLRSRGRRVRQHLQVVRRRRDYPRNAAALRARRGRRSLQGTDARLPQARHQRLRQRQGRKGRAHQRRRRRHLHRRWQAAEARSRQGSDRRRTRATHRKRRHREDQSRSRPRLRENRRIYAHRRTRHLRHRRHRNGLSATGPRWSHGRHRRRHPHSGQAGQADQQVIAFPTRPTAIPRSAASASPKPRRKNWATT